MNKYITSYRVHGKKFLGKVWAIDDNMAQVALKSRNIGEKIIGMSNDNSGTVITSIESLVHLVTHLSYPALNGNLMNPHDIVGDCGVLHELIHIQQGIIDPMRDVNSITVLLRRLFMCTYTLVIFSEDLINVN